jgi:transcriptional regulator with XRE-family HTH domain
MEEDILKQFGKRIKDLRINNKWSQQDLADVSGFHKNYVGMVERGERNISLKNIEVFAKSLNVKMSNLLEF